MRVNELILKTTYVIAVAGCTAVAVMFLVLLSSKIVIFQSDGETEQVETIPFPVSVDPVNKIIIEKPEVNQYFHQTLALNNNSSDKWHNKVAKVFWDENWYQNMASPVTRIIVIWPGERKEQISKKVGDVIGWDTESRGKFLALMDKAQPSLEEGNYYPGQYVTHKDATPSDISQLINMSFQSEVLDRYTPTVEQTVPLADALVIASLLEREASDFENMREISGVIWNRLFISMPLQLDATLQYARGSNAWEPHWWPKVYPQDKFIESPFNTYQNVGLPPSPISNPSAAAVLAALNPINTECIFYFHTSDRGYHCSETYEEHVQKLRSIYGTGS